MLYAHLVYKTSVDYVRLDYVNYNQVNLCMSINSNIYDTIHLNYKWNLCCGYLMDQDITLRLSEIYKIIEISAFG